MLGSDTLNDLGDLTFNKNNRAQIDTTDGTVIYQGYAKLKTINSSSTWRIKRTTINGPLISIEWAEGNTARNKAWEDRATLDYS